MRGLMVAVVGMGILIVAGVTVIAVVLVGRMSSPSAPIASGAAPAVATLDEPAGTRMAGVSLGPDRVAVRLEGGGPDRVVIVDTRVGPRGRPGRAWRDEDTARASALRSRVAARP